MTVAENIFIGRFPSKNGLVDTKKMFTDAEEILKRLGIAIDPRQKVERLTVGYQQIVEIAKSVSRNARVLIMDEPSAPLTNNELKYLFDTIALLRSQGVAIVYISHRLEEIFAICDRVTVFRDGQFIKTLDIGATNKEELIALMVNRKLDDSFPKHSCRPGPEVLEVRNLSTAKLRDISFSARSGEILGLAGLVGAGRTEIARAVFGADPKDSGAIRIEGAEVRIESPIDAIERGIGLIPEDRKQHGALLHLSVKDNTTYTHLKKMFPLGVIDAGKERLAAEDYVAKLKTKTPSVDQLVRNLSGGNQQKVVLSKWLLTECKVLFFDEPTRGIDVGAKYEIYQLMNALVEQGIAVVMISSEMPELLGMSDRIIVLHEGRISGELSRAEATQERVLALASGENTQTASKGSNI